MGKCRRRSWDFYPTPDWATTDLQNYVNVEGSVLEPCAGKLDISNAVTNFPGVTEVITNDLDFNTVTNHHLDVSIPESWEQLEGKNNLPEVDWIITNPPFSLSFQILKHAVKHARKGVLFLLRLSFLEPTTERAQWLKQNPPDGQIVLPRISFTGDGATDSVTCAWLLWQKGEYLKSSKKIIISIPPLQDDFEDWNE